MGQIPRSAERISSLSINFEAITFCCIHYVRFNDIGFRKFDRYKHVRGDCVNCVTFVSDDLQVSPHGTGATKRTYRYGMNFLHQVLWHSLGKLFAKNYENSSLFIFVKVTAKKNRGSFLCGHGVDYRGTEVLLDFTSVASFPNEVKLRPNSVLLTVSPTAKIMGDSGEMPESMFRARHICRTQLLIYVLTPLCGLGDLTSGKIPVSSKIEGLWHTSGGLIIWRASGVVACQCR